jgi:hypothetical protein
MKIREVVVTGQNQVELQDATLDDTSLGSNELLIETEYTYISTGTELANYTGREPKVFQKGAWCAYPWRSGYANVGIGYSHMADMRQPFDTAKTGLLRKFQTTSTPQLPPHHAWQASQRQLLSWLRLRTIRGSSCSG